VDMKGPTFRDIERCSPLNVNLCFRGKCRFHVQGRRIRKIGKQPCLRVEVFTAVTMKNGVFWDVTPCGSCKN
jgi:hypothetical protein